MTGRVVFDTSTLVGAILKSDSVPYRALAETLRAFELCISAQILLQLETVLARKRFARYTSAEARHNFIQVIREKGKIFEVGAPVVEPPCRDATDNFILALALAAEANVIVSSDHDLLALHPWRAIPILTPAQFIAEFSA